MKPGILSTKKLSFSQKELLLNGGLSLVEKSFVRIIPIDFTVQNLPENIIFTSKNAVKIVLEKSKKQEFTSKKVFCVGKKTADFLRKKGFLVAEAEHYGAELAKKISESYSSEEFLFFCGKKRRPELPNFLIQQKIKFKEVAIYDTKPVPYKIDRAFDGILFFSPSAVKSFCSSNSLEGSVVFCIGKTTALEAKKYSARVEIANKPSVENVIVQAVKYFK